MAKVEDIVRDSMRDYSEYVVHNRAVPTVEDGLKPVQRRLLWTMHNLKLSPAGNFTKSAKVVGNTTAHWHPHGDSACYDALVALTHQRYAPVQGQGNFGSWVDSPAAMRYTEVRLTPIGMSMLECVDVAPTQPNYLGEDGEPTHLASRFPALLVNGTEGIAVAVSSCLPPHNLAEIVNALSTLIKNPKATVDDVLEHVHGPDYAHGTLTTPEAVAAVYRDGRGTLKFRCRYTLDGTRLTVRSYAPHFNPTAFIEKCSDLVTAGSLLSVVDETSDSNGVRITVDFKDGAVVNQTVLPMLETSVRYSFHVLTHCDGFALKRFGFVEVLRAFIKSRREVEKARLLGKCKQVEAELSRVNAILLAADNLPAVVKALKSGKPVDGLVRGLNVDKKQAQHILRTPLTAFSPKGKGKAQAKRKKLSGALSRHRNGLSDLDSVLLKQLGRLRPFFDARKMVIGGADSAPPLQWVAFDGRSIQLVELDGLLHGKRKLETVSLFQVERAVTLVYKDGTAREYTAVNGVLPGKDHIVAVISDLDDTILTKDDSGNFCVVAKRPGEFKVMNTKGVVEDAFGLRFGEDGLLVRATGKGIMLRYIGASDMVRSKQASRGRKFLKRRRLVTAEVVRSDSLIVTRRGFYKVTPGYLVDEVYNVFANNLCILPSGSRRVYPADKMIALLKKGREPRCHFRVENESNSVV
jgi:hypothetical protein